MPDLKRVLAVTDISCLGRCSAAITLPILSTAGLETALLPTSLLSTHTRGFGQPYVHDLAVDMDCILYHWRDEELRFDGAFSGYLSSLRQVDLTLQAYGLARDGLKLCDPAMADNGQLYSGLDQLVVEGQTCLCTQADVITPNPTEAALLLERPYQGDDLGHKAAQATVRELTELGPRMAVLTGVRPMEGVISIYGYDRVTGRGFDYDRPCREGHYHGTGDLFAACLFAALMQGKTLELSVRTAADFCQMAVQNSMDAEPRHGLCFEPLLGKWIDMLR